ncbi:hypothetical protein F5Y02DRAFT_403715, partial [Annulohypoxylon stygium]
MSCWCVTAFFPSSVWDISACWTQFSSSTYAHVTSGVLRRTLTDLLTHHENFPVAYSYPRVRAFLYVHKTGRSNSIKLNGMIRMQDPLHRLVDEGLQLTAINNTRASYNSY